jgi:hypothetical protein
LESCRACRVGAFASWVARWRNGQRDLSSAPRQALELGDCLAKNYADAYLSWYKIQTLYKDDDDPVVRLVRVRLREGGLKIGQRVPG